jgi:hypothetical protein
MLRVFEGEKLENAELVPLKPPGNWGRAFSTIRATSGGYNHT